MRRPYTARQYRERLVLLAAEVPGIRLGADVIAGFPGETPDDFLETLRLIRDTPLSYLHAFPYSPRPGTESAGWADDVIASEKTRRVGAFGGGRRDADGVPREAGWEDAGRRGVGERPGDRGDARDQRKITPRRSSARRPAPGGT